MADSNTVPRRPVVLIILDGFGVNPGKLNNAVEQASTPNLDRLYARYPHTTLQASGPSVGLPDSQMGNSEVGHMIIGAGAIIKQDIVAITEAIEHGEFFTNSVLVKAARKAILRNRPLHLFGLVSDGGVHSDLDHLKAMIKLCKQQGVKPLLHMITDGRDTAPKSALSFLPQIEPLLHEAGGCIGSIAGRFYSMDRDHRWDRTELAWRAYVLGKGQRAQSAESAICSAYAAGDTDEFIRPILLPGFQPMEEKDQAVCFNFRKDRPRQIIEALSLKNFDGFDRGDAPRPCVTCMMPYNRSWNLPYAFEPEKPDTCLAEVISNRGLKQFHCSETEKYAHVTYFLNGGHSEPFEGETQHLIPSPRVATYDLKPEMSAPEIADAVVNAIQSKQYGFIVLNFANGDMVGHSAIPEAVIRSVEVLDEQVGKVVDAAVANDHSVIVTADHGNCEEMLDPVTGMPNTQHTTNPVPCLIIDSSAWRLRCSGGLSNIAPTVLQLMGLDVPDEMTARSLLVREVEAVMHNGSMDSVA